MRSCVDPESRCFLRENTRTPPTMSSPTLSEPSVACNHLSTVNRTPRKHGRTSSDSSGGSEQAGKETRRSNNGRKLGVSTVQYTMEHADFIWYHRLDCGLDWPQIAALFDRWFSTTTPPGSIRPNFCRYIIENGLPSTMDKEWNYSGQKECFLTATKPEVMYPWFDLAGQYSLSSIYLFIILLTLSTATEDNLSPDDINHASQYTICHNSPRTSCASSTHKNQAKANRTHQAKRKCEHTSEGCSDSPLGEVPSVIPTGIKNCPSVPRSKSSHSTCMMADPISMDLTAISGHEAIYLSDSTMNCGCGTSFLGKTLKNNKSNHKRHLESLNRNYKCEQCDSSFTRNDNLQVHIRKKHC